MLKMDLPYFLTFCQKIHLKEEINQKESDHIVLKNKKNPEKMHDLLKLVIYVLWHWNKYMPKMLECVIQLCTATVCITVSIKTQSLWNIIFGAWRNNMWVCGVWLKLYWGGWFVFVVATVFSYLLMYIYNKMIAKLILVLGNKVSLCYFLAIRLVAENTPGTVGGPGGRDLTLAVKSKKKRSKSVLFLKKIKIT